MLNLTPEIREAIKKVLVAVLLAVLSILGYEKAVIEPMIRNAREKRLAQSARQA